jgi:putative SOS response-associated peptidase YedK
MFNARSEQLDKSRAYQGSFRHKRCIIPAHSFVEFGQKGQQKIPYLISAVDQAIAFAGIWDYWTDGIKHVLSCAIITTVSSPEFEPYHHQMPVMLTPENAELWLNEKQDTNCLYSLFETVQSYRLQTVTIDDQYNNSRNKNKPILSGQWIAFNHSTAKIK